MISRRHVIAGLSAMVAARPLEAMAELQCSQPIGNRSCVAGIDIGDIETARQRCRNWCWAACIQTVFALHGHNVEQEAAVLKLFGTLEGCEPAGTEEIVATIDGSWIDDRGRPFRAQARELLGGQLAVQSADSSGTPVPTHLRGYSDHGARQIVELLRQGRPLIVGTVPGDAVLGHAVVLTAAAYEVVTPPGDFLTEQVRLTAIEVRDPAPENENRRVLTINELRGAFFVVSVSVADG